MANRSPCFIGRNLALLILAALSFAVSLALLVGPGRTRVDNLRQDLEAALERESDWDFAVDTSKPLTEDESQSYRSAWQAWVERLPVAANDPELVAIIATFVSGQGISRVEIERGSSSREEQSETRFSSPLGSEAIEVSPKAMRISFRSTYPALRALLARIDSESTPTRLDGFEVKRTDVGLKVSLDTTWFVRGGSS